MFPNAKPVIGLISLLPWHTSDGQLVSISRLLERAEQEALAWMSAGVDGFLVENTRQTLTVSPQHSVDEYDLAALACLMGEATQRVCRLTQKPVGVSVLANHPAVAQAIAHMAGGAWIRVPVGMGARITPYGLWQAQRPRRDRKPLPLVMDISRHQWMPKDGTVPEGDSLAALARLTESTAAALIIAADEINADWLQIGWPEETRRKPLWLLDDGSLSTGSDDRLAWVNGVVLGDAVRRQAAANDRLAPSIDPELARHWIAGYRNM